MKVVLIKIGGALMICLAVFAGIVVFPSKAHDDCWDAAPFIFALSFLIVFGIGFMKYKEKQTK